LTNKGKKPPPEYQKTRGVLLAVFRQVKESVPKPKFFCDGKEKPMCQQGLRSDPAF